jgi:hypothetical protein
LDINFNINDINKISATATTSLWTTTPFGQHQHHKIRPATSTSINKISNINKIKSATPTALTANWTHQQPATTNPCRRQPPLDNNFTIDNINKITSAKSTTSLDDNPLWTTSATPTTS